MSILIKGMDIPKDATSVTIEWWDKNDMQVRFDEFDDRETNDRVVEIDDELFKKAENAYILQQIRNR